MPINSVWMRNPKWKLVVEEGLEEDEPEADEEVEKEAAIEEESVKDQSEEGNGVSISQEEIDKLFQ